jgi:UDP-N-acetylglucosamine 4-epimerase
VGDRTNLLELTELLKKYLIEFDPKIADVEIVHGPNRAGDIPHSLASVEKSKNLLNYNPQFDLKEGLKEAVAWYWGNLKK